MDDLDFNRDGDLLFKCFEREGFDFFLSFDLLFDEREGEGRRIGAAGVVCGLTVSTGLGTSVVATGARVSVTGDCTGASVAAAGIASGELVTLFVIGDDVVTTVGAVVCGSIFGAVMGGSNIVGAKEGIDGTS